MIMDDTVGRFDFAIAGGPDSSTFPFVRIRLQRWSTSESNGLLVSAQLMTPKEIDDCIDSLKEDLDAVGKRAKDALAQSGPSWLSESSG
jgi:hypothetical protein